MEIFEMNITCFCELILAEFERASMGMAWASSRLEMKNKMMEFSFEKMGIENRIKRSRNQVLLNFDFGNFLNLE